MVVSVILSSVKFGLDIAFSFGFPSLLNGFIDEESPEDVEINAYLLYKKF